MATSGLGCDGRMQKTGGEAKSREEWCPIATTRLH